MLWTYQDHIITFLIILLVRVLSLQVVWRAFFKHVLYNVHFETCNLQTMIVWNTHFAIIFINNLQHSATNTFFAKYALQYRLFLFLKCTFCFEQCKILIFFVKASPVDRILKTNSALEMARSSNELVTKVNKKMILTKQVNVKHSTRLQLLYHLCNICLVDISIKHQGWAPGTFFAQSNN